MKTMHHRLLVCLSALALFLFATVCVASDTDRPLANWAFARKGTALRGPEASAAVARIAPETAAAAHPGLKVERPPTTSPIARADVTAAIRSPLKDDTVRVAVDMREPSPAVWIRFRTTEAALGVEDARQVTKGKPLNTEAMAKLAYSAFADPWINAKNVVVGDKGLSLRLEDSTLVPYGGQITILEAPARPEPIEVALFE